MDIFTRTTIKQPIEIKEIYVHKGKDGDKYFAVKINRKHYIEEYICPCPEDNMVYNRILARNLAVRWAGRWFLRLRDSLFVYRKHSTFKDIFIFWFFIHACELIFYWNLLRFFPVIF